MNVGYVSTELPLERNWSSHTLHNQTNHSNSYILFNSVKKKKAWSPQMPKDRQHDPLTSWGSCGWSVHTGNGVIGLDTQQGLAAAWGAHTVSCISWCWWEVLGVWGRSGILERVSKQEGEGRPGEQGGKHWMEGICGQEAEVISTVSPNISWVRNYSKGWSFASEHF